MSEKAIAKASIEDLLNEIISRADEAVIVLRIRPKVLAPGQPPAILSGGKGDMGDQLGLVALFDSQIRATMAQRAYAKLRAP